VDQYLAHRRERANVRPTGPSASEEAPADRRTQKAKVGGAHERAARKTVARIDKQLKRIETREAQLTSEMATSAADPEKLATLSADLRSLAKEKTELEADWLEAAALLE
jgi:ATP-binding cassette subfamily F protein uup